MGTNIVICYGTYLYNIMSASYHKIRKMYFLTELFLFFLLLLLVFICII